MPNPPYEVCGELVECCLDLVLGLTFDLRIFVGDVVEQILVLTTQVVQQALFEAAHLGHVDLVKVAVHTGVDHAHDLSVG